MATPSCTRSLVSLTKRLKLSHPSAATPCVRSARRRYASGTAMEPSQSQQDLAQELQKVRLPRAVQATYLAPLRHAPVSTDPLTAELQLRSYSVRNLEVFADFAMRAAYFLKLSAVGPLPLPKITERWTVPRSNFVHKKSQENFERITRRRNIKVIGGHPQTVAAWLAFVKKYHYYGIGMKANTFSFSNLSVAEELDAVAKESTWGENADVGMNMTSEEPESRGVHARRQRMLMAEPFKAKWGAYAAMSGNNVARNEEHTRRFAKRVVGGRPTKSQEPRRLKQRESEKEAS